MFMFFLQGAFWEIKCVMEAVGSGSGSGEVKSQTFGSDINKQKHLKT